MGCYIYAFAERKLADGWDDLSPPREPFDDLGYAVFAFLAGIRNQHGLRPIATPRGLPPDASRASRARFDETDGDLVFRSWLSMAELSTFDYDTQAIEGQTYRELLGEAFFADLKMLHAIQAERVVFAFSP